MLAFYIVDTEETSEIYHNYSEAVKYAKANNGTVYIGNVQNAYQEADGSWNYDDHAETFERIKRLY